MIDWQLWREDFTQGYVDCWAGLLVQYDSASAGYIAGYLCGSKAKAELAKNTVDHHPV